MRGAVADLTVLRSFLAIYRSGSITAASRQLHLTQPAVSGHLKTLETQIGRPLFVRHNRGVEATPAAEELARSVAPHVDTLEAVIASLGPEGALPESTLHLGGPGDLLATHVVPLLAFLRDHGLYVRIHPGRAADLARMLVGGELDLWIASGRPTEEGLELEPLFEEEPILVASTSWEGRLASAASEDERAAMLAAGPFVAFDETMPVVRRWFRAVLDREPQGPPYLVVPDLRAVAEGVVAGAGISVLPRHVVASRLRAGELVEPMPGRTGPAEPVFLVTREGTLRSPHVAAVRALLERAAMDWS